MSLLRGSRNRRGRPGAARRHAGPGPHRTRAVRAGAALVAVAAAVWGGPRLAGAVRDHPYFAVREVAVGGTRRLTGTEVRAVAGIVAGTSIWDVDPSALAARLVAHPWIRTARVRRHLPHRVTIQIREERPLAIVATAGGTLFYVGAHGRVFARVGDGDPLDFPYVTGLTEADLVGRTGVGPRALRRALHLLRVVERRPAGLGAISEVHVDRRRGLTLLPTRPAVPIEVGWDDFERRLDRLAAVLALWTGREGELAAVSLLFDDEVVVRPRPNRRSHGAGARGPEPPAVRRGANT